MSPSSTHVDEEYGHLQLCDPAAQTLPNTPAKAKVPEVGVVLVIVQPSVWVEIARVGEEAGVLAHGITGHLHQCLGARWSEA